MQNCKKIGFAVYDYDCSLQTGTQRFTWELIKNLANLKQSLVEYKILLKPGLSSKNLDLPPLATYLQAPLPKYDLFSRARRRFHCFYHKGLDRVRKIWGRPLHLEHLGKLWVKDWLRLLDLDLVYFPSMWYHELITYIPVAVHMHDMQHIYYPEFWKHDFFQRKVVFNWYARHASLITCSFDFVAKDMMKYLNVPAERIATVFMAPPKIDASKIADINLIKEKHPLPERFFIYPAATWPHKNHLNLIKAISRCIAKGTEVYCVCTGEHAQWLSFDHYDQIQAEIKKHHLEKYIYFTGCLPYPEVLALEKQADFFCIPTLYEAGCYPVWEACFFGKAVAASDVTMIPYQIQDTGILFNPYDVDDIAKAITLLWKDKDLRDYLGQKAKSLINNPYYSHERMAQGYHRAFVNTLVRLGRLSKEYWIEEDPAPVLDKKSWVPKFAWRKLV